MRVLLLGLLVLATFGHLAGPTAASSTRPAACAAKTTWLMRWDRSYAAAARQALVVYKGPSRRTVARQFAERDGYGVPTVFAVLAARRDVRCHITWYRVQLPTTPNGSQGWVSSADVAVARLRTRIVVDVSRRRLVLYKRGKVVMTSQAAVGKPSTPTPFGKFYVTQRLIPANQYGAYGPRALGISAHSTVLKTWVDGGPVGIHGTNERFSIGKSVSHGCIRLPNTAVLRLFKLTPLGTPVVVRR